MLTYDDKTFCQRNGAGREKYFHHHSGCAKMAAIVGTENAGILFP